MIHQAFGSPQEAGGTRHWELAHHCLPLGQTFTVVTSDLSYLTGRRVDGARGLFSEQRVGGIRVLRAYTVPVLHRSFAWRIVSFLSFMVTSVIAGLRAGPVDLVMGTSPPIFQAVSACLVAGIRRRPFLLEVRDLWPDFAVELGVLKNPVLIRMSRWLEMFLYRRARHILVNSPAYRRIIVAKGIPAEKVSLIPNGVDPAMFDPAATGGEIRQRWGLEGRFVALYAGALGLANDIPTILRAARRVQDDDRIRIVLVGDGKERTRLEGMTSELGLRNVIFTGAQPKSAMKDFLAAADVGLATLQNIPLFNTTYPNKVFDYMAAGRPTVLGIDGVIREVIEEAGGGVFVPPGDDERLAAAIRSYAADPEECRKAGLRAREHVVLHFNRVRHADEFAALLRRVGGSSGGPDTPIEPHAKPPSAEPSAPVGRGRP